MSETLSAKMPNEKSEESAPTRPPSSVMVDFVEKTGPSGERIFESTHNNFHFNGTLPESTTKHASAPIAEKTFYFNADNASPVIKENKDLGLSQADILAGIKARDKDFEDVKVEVIHHDRLSDRYDEINPIVEGDTKENGGELGIDNHLAPRSGSEKNFGTEDNIKKEETMSPQQATSELNTTRQEPTIADIAITEAKLGEIAPESDTRETVAEPEVSQDNQVVSSLAEGGTTAQIPETPTPSPTQEDLETSPASEVHEQAPAHENPPVNEPIVEARVADLVAEPVAPAPPIEEIRSEVMTPEPPVEQSASEKLSQIDNGPGEFSDIDFNKMSKESDDAVYGLSSGMRKVQEKIDNQFDKAGAPQVMSDTRGNPQGIAEAVMPVTPDEQAWQNKKNETNLENINKINSMLGNSGESADLPSPEELVAEGGVYKSGTEEGAVETGASEEPQILAEAEPDLKELVIEAGESTEKIAEDHDKYLEDLRNKATERLTNMVNQGETINAKIQELNELISKIDSMRQKLQFLKISRNLPDNAEASKEEAA